MADRLGWQNLSETPLDKNPFFERILSNPLYQWQPFVQTPSLNPDENLNLEIGETIYEDKWAYEWSIFYKLLFILPLVCIYVMIFQFYDQGIIASFNFTRRFGAMPVVFNEVSNIYDEERVQKFHNWGKDLWTYQHWIRRLLMYPVVFLVTAFYVMMIRKIGSQTVIKAAFNRDKDVVFYWTSGMLTKEVNVTELHFLEKTMTPYVLTWKHYGELNGNRNSYIFMKDLRKFKSYYYFKADERYWNPDVKKYFDDHTSTHWRGNVSKDVNKGLQFGSSLHLTIDQEELYKSVNEELVHAIKKHGPIQKYDYENSYKFQLKKKLNDYRYNLLAGTNH